VSRLYAHSKNYDMELQLDYNIELFPLRTGQEIAMALATSLARGPSAPGDEDDKDKDVWRPDGKGRRGLEEDYDYVMYGKVSLFTSWAVPLVFSCARQVYKFDGGNAEVVCVGFVLRCCSP
jgi:DNA-directed RNA polymerase I, II, and III subunit RPABC3